MDVVLPLNRIDNRAPEMSTMAAASTTRLLDVEPDLAAFLSDEERVDAHRLMVPERAIPRGPVDMPSLLRGGRAFGAIVRDGMLVQHFRVGDQVALRLLGPSDVVLPTSAAGATVLAATGHRAVAPTTLAMLGNEVLIAAHHWPRLVAGLYGIVGEQCDRIARQLAICQLPRVDQRLLAVMWLLAESWGQVTPAGTTLPLRLTHDVLGGLIGARRPTVTLALGELAQRGAILHQDRGWLLIEPPPKPLTDAVRLAEPELLGENGSPWTPPAHEEPPPAVDYAILHETVERLRAEHMVNVERFRERRRTIASSRDRCRRSRDRIHQQALSRRQAPS
jgi:hypothetical protein